ncbi:hypothetical protein [Nonomuraea candida]|uniref:hypothetical protein n=1 Tax=Nonomuraea candida TaxID=359159 RepID=UPI0005B7C2E3|nr:hypothetical protein [Nonomuraea candida]
MSELCGAVSRKRVPCQPARWKAEATPLPAYFAAHRRAARPAACARARASSGARTQSRSSSAAGSSAARSCAL